MSTKPKSSRPSGFCSLESLRRPGPGEVSVFSSSYSSACRVFRSSDRLWLKPPEHDKARVASGGQGGRERIMSFPLRLTSSWVLTGTLRCKCLKKPDSIFCSGFAAGAGLHSSSAKAYDQLCCLGRQLPLEG